LTKRLIAWRVRCKKIWRIGRYRGVAAHGATGRGGGTLIPVPGTGAADDAIAADEVPGLTSISGVF
jgi:hypothetical protein